MTPKELAQHFRDEVHDTKKPYLWSDAELLRYMNLAYSEWVRLIGGLRDSRSDLCIVDIPAATAEVDVDRRILRLINVRDAQGKELRVFSPTDQEAINSPRRPGNIRAVVFGETESTLRTIDVSPTATTLSLVVRRLPLENITMASACFEIRTEQVEYLTYGMKYRAYMKDDPDTYDKQRSDRAKAQFESEARRCKAESESANHVPRPVAYGGL